jgi:trehalose 6-phosphate synthase
MEMMALHRLADFCTVTPLHDGMNLVAKEFVASRSDNDGVLILSRFAGAAEELRTALQVNPFCESSLCSAMVSALTMSRSERQRRMSEARTVVSANNVYRWAGTLIEELDAIMTGGVSAANSMVFDELVATLA